MSRPTPRTASRSTLSLSSREQREYSLRRAILAAAHDKDGGVYGSHCFEMEVSAEIEKTLPKSVPRRGGICVPFTLAIDPVSLRAGTVGLDSKTTNQGKELAFTESAPLIEYLYNRMIVRELGAEVLDGLQGSLAFPKQTGKSTGSWVSENPGTDVEESDLTLSQIVMSPKTYQSTTSFSRQLLTQSTPRVEDVVRADLATDCALAIDRAALIGTGAPANQPTGILNVSGVQPYVLAADAGAGAVPTYADISAMRELIETANADTLAGFGWATTPPIKTKLKQTARSTSITLPVWTDDDRVDGFPARVTNQLPKNLTKGAGSNLSSLICGAWSTIVLGIWGDGFELLVDGFKLKKQGIIEATAFILCDVAVRQASSFAVAKYCAKS